MVMLTNAQNQLLYANPPARECFQLPPGDGFVLRPYLRIHPVQQKWKDIYQKLEQGESIKSLFIHHTDRGEDFLEMEVLPLSGADILSITRKITQRKKQEARWTQLRLKEDSLMSLIPDSYFLVGTNYRILEFNEVAFRWFKQVYNLELKKGRTIRTLPLASMENYLAAFDAAAKGSQTRITQQFEDEGDGVRSVNLIFSPVRNESEDIWAVMILTQDVSPLRSLEQDVKAFRERLDNISHVLPGCIYEYDVNVRTRQHWFTYLSEGSQSLLGFSPAHILAAHGEMFRQSSPAELQRVQAKILKAAENVEIWEDTFAYEHPQLGTRWIFGRSRPQKRGDHVLFSGLLLDVTDAELAREALQRQQAENQAILAAMPDAIFQVFKNGSMRNIKPANDIQRLAFNGKTIDDSDLPEDLKQYLKQGVHHALDTQETHHLAFDYELRPGEQVYYEIRLIASSDDSVFCVVRNVSELRSLTHQLQESQHTLLAMLENSGNDSIWYVNKHLELIMANPMCLQNTPRFYGRAIAKGDRILDFMSPNDPEETAIWEGYYAQALAGQRVRREYTQQSSEGQTYYVECFINPVFSDEEVIGCVCLARDISYFKTVEQSLKQMNQELEWRVDERTAELRLSKEQAEAANFAKTGFLANISHEVRTPIHAVLGFAEMIEMALNKAFDRNEIQDYARSIRKSAQTLLMLINDLLDLSQLENGAMVVQAEPLSFRQLCTDMIAMFRPRAHQKQLELALFWDKDVPEFLYIDSVRIRQVLMNLLSNAVKFTHQGFVHLKVSVDQQSQLSLCVVDSGIGIHPSSLQRIFEPFVQQEGQLTRDYGGTGLGLSITQRLVHLMQGEIEVKSQLGEGSRFLIRLPLERAEPVVTFESAYDQRAKGASRTGPGFIQSPAQIP